MSLDTQVTELTAAVQNMGTSIQAAIADIADLKQKLSDGGADDPRITAALTSLHSIQANLDAVVGVNSQMPSVAAAVNAPPVATPSPATDSAPAGATTDVESGNAPSP